MPNELTNFIHINENKLQECEISIDEIKSSELGFQDEAEQVDLVGKAAIARITLFRSNRLYIQILNIESEETIYFFDDVLGDDVNINEFIMAAICKMNKV